ncbi:MAG: hypothetical protein IKK57_02150, partial [Clostridia bacterium]|nr:hypothetical protein [Clostridia bacterium]
GLRPRSYSFKQPSATSPPRYAAAFPTSQGQEGDGGKSLFDFRIGKSAFAPLSAGESGFPLMLFGQL